MNTVSTDPPQESPIKGTPSEAEQKRTFRIALLQGTFMRMSFAFADSNTVLSAFVHRLTGSSVLVGLTGSLMPAGWMWPQLLMSHVLEHRPRKMPFYILGMSIRVTAWLAIIISTLTIGTRSDLALAATFLCCYAVAASSMGVSTIPYMDIISKSIAPQRRARFFSFRNLIGGIFSIFIGLLVRGILGEGSPFDFPSSYALLFACSTIGVLLSFITFLQIREPIQPVQRKRRKLWEYLKQGPEFIRTDRNYRLFLLFRFCTRGAGMCTPFYVPYALHRLGAPDSSIGLFITVTALSGVLSNVLWAYSGERYGVRWVLIGGALLVCLAPFMATSVHYLPESMQGSSYYLTFALSGASSSGLTVGFMSYMLNLAPPIVRPSYIGFMNTLLFPFSFMAVLAGKFVGWIDYEGTFVIAGVMGIFGLLVATKLQDVYHDEEFAE